MCLTFAPLTGVTQWGLCSVYSLPQRWGSVSRTRRGGVVTMLQEFAHCASDAVVITLLPDCCTADCPELIMEWKRQNWEIIFNFQDQTGKVSVWVSLRFSVVCLTRPGVSAVARGIFIISNLLRQKTDTNTILASHGVMSSLVKLFSVKFHSAHSLALLVKLVAEELWLWGIYGMSSDIGLHRHPSQPQRYYWPRLWRKMYRPPSRCFTAASKRFLCCKVLTAGLTFLSIKNFGGDHQF